MFVRDGRDQGRPHAAPHFPSGDEPSTSMTASANDGLTDSASSLATPAGTWSLGAFVVVRRSSTALVDLSGNQRSWTSAYRGGAERLLRAVDPCCREREAAEVDAAAICRVE